MTLRQFFLIWALMFVSVILLCLWIDSKDHRLVIRHEVSVTFTGDTLPIHVESNVEPFISIWATKPFIEVTELKNIEEP